MSLYEIVSKTIRKDVESYRHNQTDTAREQLLSKVRRKVIAELQAEREAVLYTLEMVADTERAHQKDINAIRKDMKRLTGLSFDWKTDEDTQSFIGLNQHISKAAGTLKNRISAYLRSSLFFA